MCKSVYSTLTQRAVVLFMICIHHFHIPQRHLYFCTGGINFVTERNILAIQIGQELCQPPHYNGKAVLP